jgi:DNA mismatch repair protein MSH4
MSTAADTKLLSIIEENLEVEKYGIVMQSIDRRYWSETSGHEYIQQLAFPEDLESLKVSAGGNYFAVCCFAAVCHSTVDGYELT